MTTRLSLNERAATLCDVLETQAGELNISVSLTSGLTRVIDAGVHARGGLAAGLAVARICLSGLGEVALTTGPAVQVWTDQPLLACLASQYAGWSVAHGNYFAMASGPMRACAGKEPLFREIPGRETAEHVVGVLETSTLPSDEVCALIAEDCGVTPDHLTLVCARTASIAGSVQVVARSVETALHKLHTLGFDLHRLQSGFGTAPLPPIAPKDITAIGWTNDAILYGGEVTLWVRGDDASLAEIGPRVPSSGSPACGAPFAELFALAGNDFYKMDPLLFSPAVVSFVNLDTGRTQRFGQFWPDVLARSFG